MHACTPTTLKPCARACDVFRLYLCTVRARCTPQVGAAAVWAEAAGKPGLQVVYEDDHMACIVKPQVGLHRQGCMHGSPSMHACATLCKVACTRDAPVPRCC